MGTRPNGRIAFGIKSSRNRGSKADHRDCPVGAAVPQAGRAQAPTCQSPSKPIRPGPPFIIFGLSAFCCWPKLTEVPGLSRTDSVIVQCLQRFFLKMPRRSRAAHAAPDVRRAISFHASLPIPRPAANTIFSLASRVATRTGVSCHSTSKIAGANSAHKAIRDRYCAGTSPSGGGNEIWDGKTKPKASSSWARRS